MWYLGFALLVPTAFQVLIAVRHGMDENYDISRDCEQLAIIYLIAALICFK